MERGIKNRGVIILSIISIIIFSYSVSAGWTDWFNKITGKASSQPFNISLIVSGVNPAQIVYVAPQGSTINPTENDNTTVVFNVWMYDPDGVADLNDTSVNASALNSQGEAITTGSIGTCAWKNDIDANNANYSCMFEIWYWNLNDTWTITVQGADLGNLSWVYNNTQTFSYGLLQAMKVAPDVITWSSIASGAPNQTASNDPTIINNTGNFNNSIQVNATDLIGQADSSATIDAGNFTVGTTTGAGDPECGATAMQNDTFVTITGAVANAGNLTGQTGTGTGQADLYYCIPAIPAVSSQSYANPPNKNWWVYYPA